MGEHFQGTIQKYPLMAQAVKDQHLCVAEHFVIDGHGQQLKYSQLRVPFKNGPIVGQMPLV